MTVLIMIADWYRDLSYDARIVLWLLLFFVAAVALMIGFADTWTEWF